MIRQMLNKATRLQTVAGAFFCAVLVLALSPAASATPILSTPQFDVPAAERPALDPGDTDIADFAAVAAPEAYSLRWRVGAGVGQRNPLRYEWADVRPGWYLNWSTSPTGRATDRYRFDLPAETGLGMEFVPMVRLHDGKITPSVGTILKQATRNPGHLWLVGNEPDVIWQDNVTPEEYARLYRIVRRAIKVADPTAQVAIGGMSTVTPLRMEYMQRVWDFYLETYGEEIPVDVWNIHVFILREERDNWGVEIPPGFREGAARVDQGQLYEIGDHDDLDLIEGQVVAFRRWMAAHGQQDKPLIISEYGILMPPDYGFPPERVINFMWGTFDLFHTLRDEELGYPADDYRLVQRWNWFSTNDDLFPSGNLFTDKGRPSAMAEALSAYLESGGGVTQ